MEPVHIALIACSVFAFLLHVLVGGLLGVFGKKTKRGSQFKQRGSQPWVLTLTANNYRDIEKVHWSSDLEGVKKEMFTRYIQWLHAESRVDDKLEEAKTMLNEAHQLREKIQAERDEILREAESKAASITGKAHEKAEEIVTEAEEIAKELERKAKVEADSAYPESKKLLAEANEAAAAIIATAKEEAAQLIEEAEKRGPEVEQEIADRLLTLTKLSSMVAEKEKKQDELEETIIQTKEESKTLQTKLNYLRKAFESHDTEPAPEDRVRKRWLISSESDTDGLLKIFQKHLPQFRFTRIMHGCWLADTFDTLPMSLSEFGQKANDEFKDYRVIYMEMPVGSIRANGWLNKDVWPSIRSWQKPTLD